MEFVDLKAAREFSPKHHIHKSLTATPRSDISIACWEPGQTSPIHCHPGADEIYHVVEGNGLFSDGQMITATVRYQLPPHIDHAACREHFHKIAPGFQRVTGLISKHFIWSESGWAGGVYQWETREDAQVFYGGAWLDGIVERYGLRPQIEFYEVFALTDNARGQVELFQEDAHARVGQ